MQGGAEVDEGDLGAPGPARLAGQIGRAAHRLADAVEARPRRPGPALAVGREVGEDDVRLDAAQAVVIEPHARHGLGRQVGDDHVGGGDQPVERGPALRPHRVEGDGFLVPVHLEEQGAFAGLPVGARRQRQNEPVLAAAALLDPDHVGAEIRQQGADIGAGDVAAEVQHPNSVQHARHLSLLRLSGPVRTAGRMRCARAAFQRLFGAVPAPRCPRGTASQDPLRLRGRRGAARRAHLANRGCGAMVWPPGAHGRPLWRNWQTRQTQNLLPATAWEFESPRGHHLSDTAR